MCPHVKCIIEFASSLSFDLEDDVVQLTGRLPLIERLFETLIWNNVMGSCRNSKIDLEIMRSLANILTQIERDATEINQRLTYDFVMQLIFSQNQFFLQ